MKKSRIVGVILIDIGIGLGLTAVLAVPKAGDNGNDSETCKTKNRLYLANRCVSRWTMGAVVALIILAAVVFYFGLVVLVTF
jgi:hypothetical protein